MTDDDTVRCSDPNCTSWHPPVAVVEPAMLALNVARAGDLRRAAKVVVRLANDRGPEGLCTACLVWAETYINVSSIANVDRELVEGIGFVNAGDGALTTDADTIAPGPRWAGRFLLARVRRDYDQASALIASIADEPDALTDAALALLFSCALGLRTPGTAVMRSES